MVINMECRAFMSSLPANSFDSIVTDPPYGLSKQPDMREVLRHWLNGDDYAAGGGGFMGKSWDSFVPGPKTWEQALRVLKPGGYAVVFAGSRTVDLMATSLRLAGFEVVDMLHWLYGSGSPKSLDIGKAIDARGGMGSKREQQLRFTEWLRSTGVTSSQINSATASQMASHYLTPGEQPSVPTRAHMELIRPLRSCPVPAWVETAVEVRTIESENLKRREVVGHHSEPSHAAEWRQRYDGGDVAGPSAITRAFSNEAKQWEGWGTALKPCHEPIILCRKPLAGTYASNIMSHGVGALNINGCRVGERWPGNVLHDGCLPEPMDRYFYCAKATQADRNEGLDDFEMVSAGERVGRVEGSAGTQSPRAGAGRGSAAKNAHPTVKPTAVMQWLCRLVTPIGGTILDPFCGSGSTLKAAVLEGFNAVGCEMDPQYAAIATAREEAARCKKQST